MYIMEFPINRVQLTGNLGKDPELMTTPKGKKYVRLSLATNESYTNYAGDRVQDTQWHNLIAWGALAERIAASMHKGDAVQVEGSLRHSAYDGKDGQRRFYTQVQLLECRLRPTVPAVETALS
jgi:single-strand DNA-binding protein